MMLHVMLGTRAQVIKMGPVLRECRAQGVPYRLIRLCQHEATVEEMFEMFELPPPDFELGRRGEDVTSAFRMAGWSVRVLLEGWRRRREIFGSPARGIGVVHGDAPPVLLGALLARAVGLKVAHVEAGLRSFSLFDPFPEELTRLACWRLGLVDYYFCQDATSLENVARFEGHKISTAGNTLVDALDFAVSRAAQAEVVQPGGSYAIASVHRFETIANPRRLLRVVEILESVAARVPLLFILHPPTRAKLARFDLLERLSGNPRIELRPRYKYTDFVALLLKARFLVSDGGSNQEECSYLGKPCLLLREHTERSEGLGRNVWQAGLDPGRVEEFLERLTSFERAPDRPAGSPSRRIVEFLAQEMAPGE